MYIEALFTAAILTAISLIGAVVFGGHRRLVGVERFVIPVAVGVFLSLVLFELIPETLEASPDWGGAAVAFGFIAFYVLAQYMHKRFHLLDSDDCSRKTSAGLLLIGDTIHKLVDGIVLGGAFLIDPGVGFATAVGLAMHQIPQEIIEFGVFIRAGYTRMQAALRTLFSTSGVIVGTILILLLSVEGESWVWVLTGVAAGALLFLSASDMLPRIHGNLKTYGNIWYATLAIVIGFVGMTLILDWTHAQYEHSHPHDAHEIESHDDHS
jgi:zinc and cadmium transporter